MKNVAATAWVSYPRPNPQASLRLFCFPYAGGSITAFRGWADRLPAQIEVGLIQLPGHGTRHRETPFTRIHLLAEALAEALTSHLDRPYAMLGHSLGGLIAFEVVRVLGQQSLPLPTHFFPCARTAPQLHDHQTSMHRLPDSLLVDEVQRRYDGIPAIIRQDAEMLAFFLPILRADLEMLETYRYIEDSPLDCSITAYRGQQDPMVNDDSLSAWREQTRGTFTQHTLPGGHFFLQDNPEFLSRLSADLNSITLGA